MKNYSVLLVSILMLMGALHCAAQRVYKDAVAACLLGNVKEETSIGITTSWNADGSIKDGRATRNEYQLPEKIALQGVSSTYVYDHKLRLKESSIYFGNQLSQKEEYSYATDSDLLPSSITITYPDGETVTQEFKYTTLDSHGNWTECMMTQTRRGKTTTRKQTRTITYWE